jgi:hypothetical protein
MAVPSRAEFEAVAALALATDAGIQRLRAQLELDVLVADGGLKAELQRVMALEGGNAPPRVRLFRTVVEVLRAGEVAGGNRLAGASDEELSNLLLRFAPAFREPLPDRPWRWNLALSTSAGTTERGAVADLAAHGGNERVMVRRPRQNPGGLSLTVEKLVFPARADAREAKGKAKGKGKVGKGMGKGGGKGGKGKGDKGRGGGAAADPADAAMGVYDAPADGAGAGAQAGAGPLALVEPGAIRRTHTGRDAGEEEPAAHRARLGP